MSKKNKKVKASVSKPVAKKAEKAKTKAVLPKLAKNQRAYVCEDCKKSYAEERRRGRPRKLCPGCARERERAYHREYDAKKEQVKRRTIYNQKRNRKVKLAEAEKPKKSVAAALKKLVKKAKKKK